jgi:transposase
MSTDNAALLRAEMIVKVRAGLMTAQAAAEALGVSRKTYYEWEKKGLTGMLQNLASQDPGRPALPESPREKELEAKVQALTKELDVAKQTSEIRAMLRLMEETAAKKKGKQPPRS